MYKSFTFLSIIMKITKFLTMKMWSYTVHVDTCRCVIQQVVMGVVCLLPVYLTYGTCTVYSQFVLSFTH